MSTWQQLKKPKFSDMEIAACKWAEDCGLRPWLVDLATKKVTSDVGRKYRTFDSLVSFARHFGWNPECQ